MISQLSIENRDGESALVHGLLDGVLNVALHDAPTRWVTVGELLVELVFGLGSSVCAASPFAERGWNGSCRWPLGNL